MGADHVATRWVRALMLALVVVAASAGGHAAAAGATPPSTVLLPLLLVTAVVVSPFLDAPPSPVRVTLLVLAGQLFMHVALVLTSGAHHHAAGPLLGYAAPGHLVMLAAHLCAAVAIGLWLTAGVQRAVGAYMGYGRNLFIRRVELEAERRLLAQASKVDIGHFDNSNWYDRLARAKRDVSWRPGDLTWSVLGLSGNVVTIGLMASLLASLHYALVILALASAVLSLALERRITSRLYEFYYKETPEEREREYESRQCGHALRHGCLHSRRPAAPQVRCGTTRCHSDRVSASALNTWLRPSVRRSR